MTTFYVRKPPNGNDGNDGLSKDSAWATLGKANDTLNHGDTLIIGGGDYTPDNEHITLGKYNITVIGDFNGILTGDSGWVKMRYIRITGYNNSEDTFITVRWIWTTGYGGWTSEIGNQYEIGPGKATQTIEHFVCDGTDSVSQLFIYSCGTYETGIVNLDNLWFNVQIYVRAANIFVKNSTFTCDTLESIGGHYFGGPSGTGYTIRLHNCIFKSNSSESDHAMIGFGGVNIDLSTICIDFNDYYVPLGCAIIYSQGNYYHTIEEWQNGVDFNWSGMNLNSIEVDPLFNVDGYHLSFISPCVDDGTTIGSSKDIDNEGRPNGPECDIGCDEVQIIMRRQESRETVNFPVVGECDDGSKRVYQVKSSQEFINTKLTIREDRWNEFKEMLEDARYRKSTFPYRTVDGIRHIVRMMNDEVPEPLIGINIHGNEVYVIELRLRIED